MTLEDGAPIVLTDDVSPGVAHLPAASRTVTFGRRTRELRIGDATDTLDWPTACGLSGPVYAFAGILRGRRLCGVCRRDGRPLPPLR